MLVQQKQHFIHLGKRCHQIWCGFGEWAEAFAISEALEALQAQNDPLIFPKHIDANAKACGSSSLKSP